MESRQEYDAGRANPMCPECGGRGAHAQMEMVELRPRLHPAGAAPKRYWHCPACDTFQGEVSP